MLDEELDAFVIENVAVFNAVRAEHNRVLDRLGVGRVRHHLEFAQAADVERSLELLVKEKRVPVQIPRGAHDAAGQVQLDVVDPVLDLLADRLDEAVRAVAFKRVARRQEVAARGREEVPRCKEPGPQMLT